MKISIIIPIFNEEKYVKNVLDKIDRGKIDLALKYQDNVKGMAKAAGVEDMDNSSSSQVASRTNWTNLSDYLKIERGVNDQGPNLLKKVYDYYDSNHNWRPESDPDAIGLQRWASAVKAAYEYIQKNYTVSAGNYFRKDPDGDAGDDVSNVYGNRQQSNVMTGSLGELDGVELTDTSYAEARSKYKLFDIMMQSGVGYYIKQVDANRLVKFLTGDFSENFKVETLKALVRNKESGGEPADIQQALALGRQNMESVFDKFDKLPLQEKLNLLDKSNILEKWSKKYKDSINCSNPKGFSQKAHCAGKKKKKTEGKRIPRKKGQPAGSKKHSDLYTDENPKGTIKGLKFATVKDAKTSVSKIKSSGKTHAHKIQAAVAMEQRAKAAGKKTAASVYRTYINKMKKKTKNKS